MKSLCLITSFLCWEVIACLPVPASELSFQLEPDEVVAFVGGTNIVNMQKAGYLESMLVAAYPDANLRFRDFAWEGDTVEQQGTVSERWRKGKFGNLSQQLLDHGVTTVFVQFGQCEALKEVERIPSFIEAYDRLLSTCKQSGRQVVVISPIPYQATTGPLPDLTIRNVTLQQYVFAIERLADDRDCLFVSLYDELIADPIPHLTTNGLHVRPEAQKRVADVIARRLGVPPGDAARTSNLREAVVAKHQLWMSYWRPANWKCLYGDDGQREFGKATGGGLTLRQEWQRLPGLIAKSEQRIWALARQVKGVDR